MFANVFDLFSLEKIINRKFVQLDLHGHYTLRLDTNKILISGYLGAGSDLLASELGEVFDVAVIDLNEMLAPLEPLKYSDPETYLLERRRAFESMLNDSEPLIIHGTDLLDLPLAGRTRVLIDSSPFPSRKLFPGISQVYRNLFTHRPLLRQQLRLLQNELTGAAAD